MATAPFTLASKIRSKYPGAYDSLSDSDLEQKIIAKYPQYKELASPPEAVKGGASIGDQLAAKGTPYDALAKATGIGPAEPLQGLTNLRAGMESVKGQGLPPQPTLAGNVGQLAGILGHAAQPLVGALAPETADAAIPSTERAGAALNDVRSSVGQLPISMEKPGDTALKLFEQSQRGASLPTPIRKFIIRATTPDAEPITYAEAKDFQSNISSLSATDRASISPNQYRLIGQLNSELKDSLKGAAEVKDKGDIFSNAMQEYHAAMKAAKWSENAISVGWKLALGAAGVAGAEKIYSMMGSK